MTNYYITFALHFVSIILSLIMIIILIAKGRKNPLVFSYIGCISLVFVWSLGYIIELNSTSQLGKLVSVKIQYIPVIFIGISWCLFCLIYTSSKLLLKRPLIYSLFAIQGILCIIRNSEYIQILFWLNVFINYTYVFIGAYLLIAYMRKKKGLLKTQAFLLLSATILPILSNLYNLTTRISDSNPLNTAYLDLTPVSFSFSLLFFSVAIFRYKFMNISTIAYKKIISNLNSSIIVVDTLDKITNYNETFKTTFGNIFDMSNTNRIRSFAKTLRKNCTYDSSTKSLIHSFEGILTDNLSGELKLNEQTYSVNIQIISNKNGIYLGKIITFHDITEYKTLLSDIEEKNTQLNSLNSQLIEYNKNVEELTIAKERNRFAMDMHDTLGHTISSLIRLLEVSSINIDSDINSAKKNINEAITISRSGLQELRKSIYGLSYQEIDNKNIKHHISSMISSLKSSGTDIDFTLSGDVESLNNHKSKVIFRVIQESITNSIKHGKASSINIILKTTETTAKLFIIDNGKGCDNIKAGFGMTAMNERIKNVNGTFIYGSDGTSGFNLRVEIPL